MGLDGWETESFKGQTHYRLVKKDGDTVLHARADNAASGLGKRISIDLTETPWLRWRWQPEQMHAGLEETRQDQDDYTARIYVVKSGGWLPWRARAIAYVWAVGQPLGSDWPNAYSDRVRMLAVQSGPPEAAGWHWQQRNVREDFRRLFGEDVTQIDGVALMTDADNSGGRASAWYADIAFHAQAETLPVIAPR